MTPAPVGVCRKSLFISALSFVFLKSLKIKPQNMSDLRQTPTGKVNT